MIVTNQLCHIFSNENSGYEDAVVTEIYDEYIILEKKIGGKVQLPNEEP